MKLRIRITTLLIGFMATVGNGQELTELDKKNGLVKLVYPETRNAELDLLLKEILPTLEDAAEES